MPSRGCGVGAAAWSTRVSCGGGSLKIVCPQDGELSVPTNWAPVPTTPSRSAAHGRLPTRLQAVLAPTSERVSCTGASMPCSLEALLGAPLDSLPCRRMESTGQRCDCSQNMTSGEKRRRRIYLGCQSSYYKACFVEPRGKVN